MLVECAQGVAGFDDDDDEGTLLGLDDEVQAVGEDGGHLTIGA